MLRHRVTALAALAAALVSLSRLEAAAAETVPEGLTAGDWSSICAAYDAGRHAAYAIDGGFAARNPGQQWVTRFDGRGFEITPDSGGWSFGLDLVHFGVAGEEAAMTRPEAHCAEGARVSYDWDETLAEWYVNDARGLEHGYTVHARPEGAGVLLAFELAVRGGLEPAISSDGRDVQFASAGGGAVLTYAGLSVVDADGRPLPAEFTRTERGLRLTIDDAGARYPLTIDPYAQQAYLKASNSGNLSFFGYSVCRSGDTVVVGAYRRLAWTGAAYVFVRSGTTWSQQACLQASNTEPDEFGKSVSISGDTLVVGAPYEDSAATGVNGNEADNSTYESGAAYVFVRTGATWSQQAYLKASNTGANDHFGMSASVSGDTVVIGAYGEDSAATGVNGNQADSSAPYAGAAYVFTRSGATWSQQAYLKASNTEAGDFFGGAVSVSGDTVVAGANEDSAATGVNGNQADNNAPCAGAAYVFTRSGATWSQQAYLKASNTGAKDHFGMSASVSGDTVVVGAPGEDSSATGVNGNQADNSADNAGAAHVFMRTASTWSQQAYLKASNTDFGDEFGNSVSVSGDTVVVGAEYEDSAATGVNGYQADNSAVDAGAAYVFDVCSSTAVATSYGAGKPGTAGVPVLSSTNLPKIGTTADLTISNGLAGAAPVLLLAGFAPAAMPFDGGTLLVTPAFVVGLPPLGAGGSLVLPVPITPWADGVHVYFQAMFFDPGATGYYQSAQTNGLDWTVGG